MTSRDLQFEAQLKTIETGFFHKVIFNELSNQDEIVRFPECKNEAEFKQLLKNTTIAGYSGE